AIAVRLILRTAGCFANDAGTLSFIVKYDDNSTRERTFCGKFDFGEFFAIVKEMIPPCEKSPQIIYSSEVYVDLDR
ncbi:MAG: hypothetical protein IK083_02905, partial [Abditibacteriota bacterium]|nr:hypothetical protein [Abditibacteriota bacterium]